MYITITITQKAIATTVVAMLRMRSSLPPLVLPKKVSAPPAMVPGSLCDLLLWSRIAATRNTASTIKIIPITISFILSKSSKNLYFTSDSIIIPQTAADCNSFLKIYKIYFLCS